MLNKVQFLKGNYDQSVTFIYKMGSIFLVVSLLLLILFMLNFCIRELAARKLSKQSRVAKEDTCVFV
ncbi:hypothetical protein QR680_016424 [Steinernema hermaphroditum]|uniref:Uncharacterized protein n=1 Tax=Steinernema hermaphroditum TaxID=289476 RepID=A0AA39HC58_9BILA|nr:hypothetical protein QR680_016424 [Steinernema hermaphroditum]